MSPPILEGVHLLARVGRVKVPLAEASSKGAAIISPLKVRCRSNSPTKREISPFIRMAAGSLRPTVLPDVCRRALPLKGRVRAVL